MRVGRKQRHLSLSRSLAIRLPTRKVRQRDGRQTFATVGAGFIENDMIHSTLHDALLIDALIVTERQE